MPLAPGTRLGHYEIVAPLGAGGMGEVYSAHDPHLQRQVAIKVLPTHLAQDPDLLARFQTEARAVAALSHPNILAIYDFGTEGSTVYAVMELLEGETLRKRLVQGPPNWRKAAEIGAFVADGLAAAHAKGIVHRDLKPDNIFLTSDGRVKILDFGLARKEEDAKALSDPDATVAKVALTQPGTVLGTVGYMSPEQVKGERAGPGADIFALGCVLYEMVSGHSAFARPTQAESIVAVLSQDPRPLTEFGKPAPPEFKQVIARCVQKNPAERFQSAGDLAYELRALASTGTGAGSASALALSWQRRHRNRIAWMAASLAALLVALGLFLYFRGFNGKGIESLAVVPFLNGSADPNAEYLSDGIADSLMNSLSKLPRLKVVSRASVFRYKGREVDPQVVGRELKVQGVLTGRIVQRGDNVSISAELVDARDNTHLWGEQYNRKLSEVMAVQEEISREISNNLRYKLTGEQKTVLTKRYTQNNEAYQDYLKGRYYWNKRTPEALKLAISHFEKAIATDPAYALAYAGLADCYVVMSGFTPVPPRESYPKAKAAATKALEIDPNLAEAHTTLANVHQSLDFDWSGAEASYRKVFDLNPGYATPHQWYDECLMAQRRFDAALAEARKAQELDPLSLIIHIGVGDVLYASRHFDEAIQEYRKPLAMDPNFALGHYAVGVAYLQKSMYAESIAELQNAVQVLPNSTRFQGGLGYAYGVAGKHAEAQKILDGLTRRAEQAYLPSLDIAYVHLGLGQKDRALELLAKAVDERGGRLFWLQADPRFDPLRSDPRFADLLRRMNLTP